MSKHRKLLKSPFENILAKYSLKRKRVYILPTKKGALILLNFFILFNVGNIYGSNFVLLFSFILISLLVIYMIQTTIALSNFKVLKFKMENIYAEDNSSITINYEGSIQEDSDLEMRYDDSTKLSSHNVDKGQQTIQFTINSKKRGQYQFDRLKIRYQHSSTLFKSWTYAKVPNNFFVYPKKIAIPKHIENRINSLSHQNTTIHNEELIDFKEVENINHGDKVNWKLFAKTKKYFIPLYSKIQNEEIIIRYSEIDEDKESKLQIISSLASYYYQAKIKFSVDIENKTFHAIENKVQFQNLMEYLACF